MANKLLALTWNANESGRLWERRWYFDQGFYFSTTSAPGVYVPPHEYSDEASFWAEFEKERNQFQGVRFDG